MTEPLVGNEVDLRDFPFMPVDIGRLFGSEFHALSDDGAWRAGVTLWLKSYHQVPAASIPDDDIALTRLAELGRDVKAWRKVKDAALRGWVKCSDGRLYHPVVAEKALEGWIEKLCQRKSSAAGNAKRYGQTFDPAPFDVAIETAIEKLSALNPSSRSLAKRLPKTSRRENVGTSDGPPNDVPSGSQEKGQGREEKGIEILGPKRVRTRHAYSDDFAEFWRAYPTDANMGKQEAFDEWQKLSLEDRAKAMASCPAFRAYCAAHKDYRPIHANRYLARGRFEGHAPTPAGVSTAVFVKIGMPAWAAWEAHYRETKGQTPPINKEGTGWWFPSELPPKITEAA